MSNNWFIGNVEYFILHRGRYHFVVDENFQTYYQGTHSQCLAWLENAYIDYTEGLY